MFNVYEEIKNEIGFEFPKDTKFVPCSSGALKIRRTDGKITRRKGIFRARRYL